jgi:outer membrane immunogenic protein
VLGLVTDINLADFNSNSNTLGISVSNATNWWGSTNLRLGFSQFGDHLLPYAFGGLAYGGKKTDISGFSASTTSAGWDAGAGIETRITRNVSIFIEGKYVDLGGLNVPINPGMNLFGNQQFTFATITGGLNLRF